MDNRSIFHIDTLYIGEHTFEDIDKVQIETTKWNNKVWTDSNEEIPPYKGKLHMISTQ